MDDIAEMLDELGGSASIRFKDGPFHTRIIDQMSYELDQLCEDPEEIAFDVVVNIKKDGNPKQISICLSAISFNFDLSSELSASELSSEEIKAIRNRLSMLIKQERSKEKTCKPRVIVRKNASHQSYDIHVAAQKLNVSRDWLKKVIPCSHCRYEEKNGKKTIEEYFWSKELIERLYKIRHSRPEEADYEYIADNCCEGDLGWAHEIVASLKNPNKIIKDK